VTGGLWWVTPESGMEMGRIDWSVVIILEAATGDCIPAEGVL
jgi:hypothetical protein